MLYIQRLLITLPWRRWVLMALKKLRKGWALELTPVIPEAGKGSVLESSDQPPGFPATLR